MIPCTWKIYKIHSENISNYFFNIRGILLNFCVLVGKEIMINSIKFPEKTQIKIQ